VTSLAIRRLRKTFGGLEVISNLNLLVREGERHALIGPNGAGKTTLFNLITGWISPTSGEIYAGSERLEGHGPSEIARSGISRSFQKNMLFEGLTVFENLRIACQANHPSRRSLFRTTMAFPEIARQARMVAEQMGLHDHLGEQVGQLSYGQKRQLEVALALCCGPRILLMDEPAAGVSPSERQSLISLINALPRTLTILLVEHDMDVVFATCDIITVMSYGRVLVTGTRDQIRDNPQVADVYLGRAHA
jgi:branched-chain amino acid transport system ATP-binding protein